MKKISIVIPTYNEEENVVALFKELENELSNFLSDYCYEIIFIDNSSTDKTQDKILELCENNKNVKAIFNARNFGQNKSPFYGLCQATGDCAILMAADFQDPISKIKEFVREWENGYKIVIGIKSKSKENKLMYIIRTLYYKLIKSFSDVDQIEHFTGFGLYDKAFIEVLNGLEDSNPYLRGIVAELGFERKEIEYTQEKRKYGKSSYGLYKLYDTAMLGVTSYTKVLLRLAIILGFGIAFISFCIGMIYLIYKIIYWDRFTLGMAPVTVGVFFIGSIQLMFIGFLGEYILSINTRVMKRPLVVEEKRINWD